MPPEQVSPPPQTLLHAPQFNVSKLKLVQLPLQRVPPPGHGSPSGTHMFNPSPMQMNPSGQPHSPPQPSPPHHPSGQYPAQLPQTPPLQCGLGPGQTFPHVPQLLGSESKTLHSPLHFTEPSTQA
jgi:hypothetical protein